MVVLLALMTVHKNTVVKMAFQPFVKWFYNWVKKQKAPLVGGALNGF
jgi:isocitrate dehydrogenase